MVTSGIPPATPLADEATTSASRPMGDEHGQGDHGPRPKRHKSALLDERFALLAKPADFPTAHVERIVSASIREKREGLWREEADRYQLPSSKDIYGTLSFAKRSIGLAQLEGLLQKATGAVAKDQDHTVMVTVTGPLRDAYFGAQDDGPGSWVKNQIETMFAHCEAMAKSKGLHLSIQPLKHADEQRLENADYINSPNNHRMMRECTEKAGLKWVEGGVKPMLSVGGSSTQTLGFDGDDGAALTVKLGANNYTSTEGNYAALKALVSNLAAAANKAGADTAWATSAWGYRIGDDDHCVLSKGKRCELEDAFSQDFQKALDETPGDLTVILMNKKKYEIEASHAMTSARQLAQAHPRKKTYVIEASSGQAKLIQPGEDGQPVINMSLGKRGRYDIKESQQLLGSLARAPMEEKEPAAHA